MAGVRKKRTIARGNSSRSFSSFGSGGSSDLFEDDVFESEEMAALEALRISTHSDKSGSLRKSVVSIAPEGPQTNSLSEFTINKLQFDKLGLFNREEEIKTILNCLDSVLSGSLTFRKLVCVSGPSGTGKTALTQVLEKPVKDKGGLYVQGKFSQQQSQEHPFSAIITACGQICEQIVILRARNQQKVQEIKHDLRDGLGSELRLLFAFSIPHLEILFESDSTFGRYRETETNVNSEGAKNRFHYALLRFIRIVCQHFPALVMVIDDLQWADEASLELLEQIMIDRKGTNVMIVTIFRSNEIHDDHIFKALLEDLENRNRNETEDTVFEISTIEIQDLDLPAVHLIVERLLRMEGESEKTKGLAELCLKKTHGNPFFLLRFLSVLNDMKLLQFNLGTLQWHWDEEEIESTIPATDNVADLLQTQMALLPGEFTGLLKLAAILGSKFSLDLLEIAARHFEPTSPPESGSNTTMARFDQIIDLGYFVRGNIPGYFQWSHDSIQDAALSLIPEESRPDFQFSIGEWLVEQLDDEEVEDHLFVVVNLLNKGGVSNATEEEREKFAQLNYQAAAKASTLSAFLIAADFASNGISMLPSEAFAFHSKLALELYTVGAKAEGSVGNTEQMELYCYQVLAEDQLPLVEKLPIYHILIDHTLNRGNVAAAKELCLNVLSLFHCYIPGERCMVSLGSWINTLRIKKSTMSPSHLTKLEELKDPLRLQLMRLLDQLTTCMYLTQDSRMSSVIFRNLNWTLHYGYCEHSPPAFALASLYLVGIVNDLQGGRVYGEQALELLKRTDSRYSVSRTYMLVYGNTFAWTHQARDLCKPLFNGYEIGLKTGEIESALWNAYYLINVRFMLGTSLETLVGDLTTYSLQMRDLKRNIMACLCDSMKQVMLNVMGRDNQDSPTQWYGEAFSEEDQRTWDNDEYQMSLSWSSLLNTYFGNYIECAEICLAVGHDFIAKARPASISIMWNTFFSGVSCFAAAREAEDAEYAKLGRQIRKKIKGWVAMGNPNCKYYDMLLEAEFLVYKGQHKTAIKQFEAAFMFAARSGYQHDAAFAAQRLGDFYLNVMDDQEEATYRLGEAIKYWKGWGAHAIVSSIQARYSDLELDCVS